MAYNYGEWSDWSDNVEYHTLFNPELGQVQDVIAVQTDVGEITVSWTPLDGASHYEVTCTNVSSTASSTIVVADAFVVAASDTFPASDAWNNNQIYKFRVRGRNGTA